jgi:hypothetical protein
VNYAYHSPSETVRNSGLRQLCSLCRAPISPAHLLCGSCQGGDKLQAEVVRLRQLVEAAFLEGCQMSGHSAGRSMRDRWSMGDRWEVSAAKRRLEG